MASRESVRCLFDWLADGICTMTREAPPENLTSVMVSSARIWFHFFRPNQCVLVPLAGQPRCQFIQGDHHVLSRMGLGNHLNLFLAMTAFVRPDHGSRFAYRPRPRESSHTDGGKTLLEYEVCGAFGPRL
jgi:hypothetical protein